MARIEIDSPQAPSSPFFAQAVEVRQPDRLLIISGQTPTRGDWTAPADFEAQARLAWQNLFAQLAAANMTADNLLKVTIFLADRAHLSIHRDVYDEVLAGRRIAVSTIITGLVDESWLVEIEGVAAA